MGLAYNAILHWHIVFINSAIILKEFSMEFWQAMNDNAGSDQDDVSLGFHDLWTFLGEAVSLLNPLTWVTAGKNEVRNLRRR